jgi:hypothetical protein
MDTEHASEQRGRVLVGYHAGRRNVFEEAADVEDQTCHSERVNREIGLDLECREQHTESLGHSIDGALVNATVSLAEFRISGGDDAELQHGEAPLRISARRHEDVLDERERTTFGEPLSCDATLLDRSLFDARFEQAEKQVRLAREVGVHGPLREAGFIGDRIKAGSGIAEVPEHSTGGGQKLTAVLGHLLHSGQTFAPSRSMISSCLLPNIHTYGI